MPAQRVGQHGLRYIARRRHRRRGLRVGSGLRFGLAVADFIALHCHARERLPWPRRLHHGSEPSLRVAHRFLRCKHGHHRQQAQARGVAVNAMRVDQRLAQHLQATAKAQHRPPLRGMAGNGRVQPLRAQPGQVATGVFGARQNDPVRRGHVGWAAGPDQAHARHVFQRLELVQVADAGVDDNGDGALNYAG